MSKLIVDKMPEIAFECPLAYAREGEMKCVCLSYEDDSYECSLMHKATCDFLTTKGGE